MVSTGRYSGTATMRQTLYAIPVLKNIHYRWREMHEKLEIIHEHNKPYGVRDSTGFLFFFPQVTKYTGQEARYRQEIFEQFELADYLLESLKNRATGIVEAKPEQHTTAAGTPLLSPEPHLGPREPMHGDALVEFVDE
jgi:hypothetical protein